MSLINAQTLNHLVIPPAFLSLLLFASTWRQTRTWHDSRALWEHAIEAGHDSSVAEMNLGVIEERAGHDDAAIERWRAALILRPGQGAASY